MNLGGHHEAHNLTPSLRTGFLFGISIVKCPQSRGDSPRPPTVCLLKELISKCSERLHFHFSLSCIGEGNGSPLQCSCLENPRDGGAWWAAVYGVAQSWTQLKRLSSSSRSVKDLMAPNSLSHPRFIRIFESWNGSDSVVITAGPQWPTLGGTLTLPGRAESWQGSR